jgi:predicted N-acetyltransferase YhbS
MNVLPIPDCMFSPLEGEMAAQRPEGVLAAVRIVPSTPRAADTTPPVDFVATLPSRGREGVAHFAIAGESAADVAAREALLDRAMGPGRKRKSSEKLRRGRLPAEGLGFVARDACGAVVGTVRLWDVRLGECGGRALLLGPLAVNPSVKATGIGSALMRHAIAEARRLGHCAILLVGDAPYYARFGFSADKTGNLAMPGPYERHRFLALELVEGALDGAAGVLRAAGRKLRPDQDVAAA